MLNPIRQTVSQGDNAYIQCTATGDEPIDIYWLPVNRSLPDSVYTNKGDIRFSNIKLEDTGKYRCVARNHAGEADSVAEVVVTCKYRHLFWFFFQISFDPVDYNKVEIS